METAILPLEDTPNKLFLRFFVFGVFAAPSAPFLKLDFALYGLAIFARPIADALARCTLKLDKIVLRHGRYDNTMI